MPKFTPINRITQNLTALNPKTIGISPSIFNDKKSSQITSSNDQGNLAISPSDLAYKLRESTKTPLVLSTRNFPDTLQDELSNENFGKLHEGTIEFDQNGEVIFTPSLEHLLQNRISLYDLLDLLKIPKQARPEDPQVN